MQAAQEEESVNNLKIYPDLPRRTSGCIDNFKLRLEGLCQDIEGRRVEFAEERV